MARFAVKPHLRTSVKLPPLVEEEGAKPRQVSLAVHVHENHVESELRVKGAGIGVHNATVRFDVDRNTFDQVIHPEWVGDEITVPLPFVPAAVIAVIDGSDEIRF